jgi:putative ABC transport system permease protein
LFCEQKRNHQYFRIMPFNYFKISYRHLVRNKIYGMINILGLAVGIASVLLIALYVRNELSFDKFFENSDRIHRVALERIYPDRTRNFASSVITLAPVLKEHYPEVEATTRMHRLFFQNEVEVTIGDKDFLETKFMYGDADFFKVFSHVFLHGNPETALDAPDKVVVTESTAKKYFGRTDVLNQSFKIDTSVFQITGVIEDIPHNSHIHFDLMGSIEAVGYLVNAIRTNSWMNPWVYTYVKLKKGVDPKTFEAKFDDLVETYGGGDLSQRLGEDYAESGHKFAYFLQPIETIHLHSKQDIEIEPNSDIMYVYLLSVIAVIILIISTINYVNLSVARSPVRAKEVGIRKVVGVNRATLITQFLAESTMISLISAGLAVGIVALVLPFFNDLLSTVLSLSPLLSPMNLLIFSAFILMVGILSGFYPAMVIAAIQPARILKGSYKSSRGGNWLRNGLTTLQFIISMVMISGSVIVHQQMNYFRDKNLGFNQENIVTISYAQTLGENYQAFRSEVESLPGVIAIGGANGMPGQFHGSGVYQASNPAASDLRANAATFDDYFFDAMGFEMIEGRPFSPGFNDSLSVIINETAAKSLGFTDPVGETFKTRGQDRQEAPMLTVIGVIADYHFFSLHSEIGPMVISNGNANFTPPSVAVRVKAENMKQTLDEIEAKWMTFSQENFRFSFLDQELQKQYSSDQATGSVFDIFTLIAILMSCVGLFGLTTYIAQQKTREMSIRKVLGASVPRILLTFSREFFILIGLAFLIGIPVSYFLMREWLTNFAYHIEISVSVFFVTALIMIGLVLITLSYQSWKLARLNPSDALRSE